MVTCSRVSNSVSSVRLISRSRYIFSRMLKQESCWHRSSLYRVASILEMLSLPLYISVEFSKAPAPGLTCGSKYGADGGILQSSQALRVVDCCLVTELIVPLMEQILERKKQC